MGNYGECAMQRKTSVAGDRSGCERLIVCRRKTTPERTPQKWRNVLLKA
jgi:hypothetical protein